MSINGLKPVDSFNLTPDDLGNLNICATVSEWLLQLALPDDIQEKISDVITSCYSLFSEEP